MEMKNHKIVKKFHTNTYTANFYHFTSYEGVKKHILETPISLCDHCPTNRLWGFFFSKTKQSTSCT